MTQAVLKSAANKQRRQWRTLLHHLAADIERWSTARRWAVARNVTAIEEPELGPYEVPTLHIHTGQGTLIVEPVARNIVGADGRVDLYNLGDLRRLTLVRRGREWQLFTEDRVAWPNPWNEGTFAQVAEALTAP